MRAQPWSVEAAFDTLTNHPLLNFVCAGFAVSDAVPRSTRAKSNAASKAAFIVGLGSTSLTPSSEDVLYSYDDVVPPKSFLKFQLKFNLY